MPNRVQGGKLRKFGMAVVGAALAAGVLAAPAQALPGQCPQTPWGGFCDGPARADGSWYHCENAMGFSNCFYVRPVPLDVDGRGWVPA